MQNKYCRKFNGMFFLVLMMGILLSTSYLIPVHAATHTPATGISVAVSGSGSGSVSDNMSSDTITVTVKGKSGWLGSIGAASHTATITVTNDSTSIATITFDWSASSVNQLTIDGTSYTNAAGSFGRLLNPGDSFSITIVTGKNDTANTFVMSHFNYTVAKESSFVTFVYDDSLGSVTVDGTSVGNGGVQSVSLSTGAELVATPNSGNTFLGWVDTTSRKLLSTATTYSIVPSEDMTVQAAFIAPLGNVWFMLNKTTCYDNLNDAIVAAGANGTIVPMNDGILPAGNYTIPSGVTLLIPFDSAGTTITNNMGDHLNKDDAAPAKTSFRQLTLASGVNITVASGGSINVGSRAYRQMVGQVGPYGSIVMEQGSNITLNSGSFLYAWGYIFPGASGAGTITVNSGATVYENLSVMDYPGSASTTSDIYTAGLFPLRAYAIFNVEVPMTFQYGAKEYVFYSLWGSSILVGYKNGYANFIGDDSSWLFQLNSGSTLEKSYSAGKQVMVIDGDSSINALKVKINVNITSTSTSGIPIPSGFHITLKSGVATINDNIIISEGVRFNINHDAKVNLNGKNVYVMDSADDPGAVSASDIHGTAFTRVDQDAIIDINGTVYGGGLYTSTNHASIISSQGTGKVEFTKSYANTSILFKSAQATQSTIAVTQAYLKNADDTFTQTVGDTYTYVDGHWRCTSHVYGEGQITTAPTCTESGLLTKKCTLCQYAMEETVDAMGHTDADPVDSTCDVCGTFFGCYHEHTIEVAGTDATCEDTGLTSGVQCTDCGTFTVAQQVIPALGHQYSSEVTTAPSCLEGGETTYTCTVCGHTKTEPIAATGHIFELINSVPPTCTSVGQNDYECACGETKTELVPLAEHAYGDVTYTWVDFESCTAHRACTVDGCGYEETAEAAITNVVTTQPTCSAGGVRTYTATFAADQAWATVQTKTESIAIDADAHAWTNACDTVCNNNAEHTREITHSFDDWVETTAPGCETDGEETRTCGVCGEKETQTVPATGHTEETVAGKAPTCTESGLTEGKKCSVCGNTTVEQEVIPATGHSYTTEVTAPTCTEKGYTTHTCSVCGDSYKDTYVDAKGHTEVVDAAVAPTCTATGLTEGKHCSACGETIVAQQTVAALGHSYNAVVTVPTCTDKGYTTYTCSVCGDSYVSDEVASLGHSYKAVVTAPTCTVDGYTTYTCSVCGDSYVSDEVASLGHSYKAVVTAPTFDAQGYTTHTCSACGEGYVDSYVPTLIAKAKIGEQRYQTLAEAFAAAGEGTTIVLLANAEYHYYGSNVTVDLNGYTWTGTFIGTLKMNGGTLITAEGYKMAGPDADYYKTNDAVFTMSLGDAAPLVDVTVHSGTMTVVPTEWWTGKGQVLIIEQGATLIIPEGTTMQVLSSVIVEGTVQINGEVNLYDKDATITAPEGLANVVTTAGDTVWYTGGKYTVHDHSHGYDRSEAPVNGVGANIYRCECADEYEVATYVITFSVDGNTYHTQTLENGTMPEIPADPTKDATAQYTYTFKGWDAQVVAANAPVTYTAVFDATVNTYTITFIDFFGNSTSATLEYGKNIAFPEPITETLYLNVTFLGWKQGDEIVSGAQSVVGDATYVSSYRVDSIKFGAVWMAVSVDANINATIFVQVDHGVDFAGEGFEEVVLPGADSKLYMRAVSISAEDINNNAFGIGVTYKTLHGDISKQFSSLILTYMEALDGAPSADDAGFSKELVTSILAYGSAVRQYFHNEFNEEWADLTVSSSELQTYYNNYNIKVSATGDLSDGNKKYVDLRSANVQFQTDYTMRYYFKLNDVDFTKITGYGVIVTDGNGYEKTYDFEGKPIRDPKDVSRYMVLYEVEAEDITKDMYVTVYVTTETETYHSDTMQYSLYKYLIRQLYMYSLTPDQGGKRVSGDTDGQKTAQYVAMLNSLLQLGKAYNEYTANISN